jgi:hypothetical protein
LNFLPGVLLVRLVLEEEQLAVKAKVKKFDSIARRKHSKKGLQTLIGQLSSMPTVEAVRLMSQISMGADIDILENISSLIYDPDFIDRVMLEEIKVIANYFSVVDRDLNRVEPGRLSKFELICNAFQAMPEYNDLPRRTWKIRTASWIEKRKAELRKTELTI